MRKAADWPQTGDIGQAASGEAPAAGRASAADARNLFFGFLALLRGLFLLFGSRFSLCGLFFGLLLDDAECDNRGNGEVAVMDDRRYALRQLHIADMQAVADVRLCQIDLDVVGNSIRRAVEFHL